MDTSERVLSAIDLSGCLAFNGHIDVVQEGRLESPEASAVTAATSRVEDSGAGAV